MKLFSEKPDSKGKAAVIARSKQLTDFKWTPVKDVPTYTRKTGRTVLPANVEVSGIPYSSTEPIDKFITENVSFETFLSAVSNPDSVFYNKDMGGDCDGARWTYYGIVCNGLARYALGIDRRYNTRHWLKIPGMKKVADSGKYCANDIRLCDTLHVFGDGKRSHVALITDILRDENGTVRQIEVSEAIRTSCVRRQYDVDLYFEKFNQFDLCRYDYTDSAPECDQSINELLLQKDAMSLPAVAVDYGNKSNYFYGEETLISVFKEGNDVLEIYRDGKMIEKLAICGASKITRKFDKGYYTIKLSSGASTEFCVVQPIITFTNENGALKVNANANDLNSEILYMDFRGQVAPNYQWGSLVEIQELTDEEKKSGIIERKIPLDEAKGFKIYFKNKYGIWTHKMIFL